MIEIISALPDDSLGFSAKGTVTADDYESILMPAVGDILNRHRKIRVLYHLGEEFDGFELGALWDDAKMGLKHPLSWERVAVVTDSGWVRKLSKGIGLFLLGWSSAGIAHSSSKGGSGEVRAGPGEEDHGGY